MILIISIYNPTIHYTKKDKEYYVEFYISLAEASKYAVDNIGMIISRPIKPDMDKDNAFIQNDKNPKDCRKNRSARVSAEPEGKESSDRCSYFFCMEVIKSVRKNQVSKMLRFH